MHSNELRRISNIIIDVKFEKLLNSPNGKWYLEFSTFQNIFENFRRKWKFWILKIWKRENSKTVERVLKFVFVRPNNTKTLKKKIKWNGKSRKPWINCKIEQPRNSRIFSRNPTYKWKSSKDSLLVVIFLHIELSNVLSNFTRFEFSFPKIPSKVDYLF